LLGAVQGVVVCGKHDLAKRSMIAAMGYAVVSEWYYDAMEDSTSR
jgi:hypothetical protein